MHYICDRRQGDDEADRAAIAHWQAEIARFTAGGDIFRDRGGRFGEHELAMLFYNVDGLIEATRALALRASLAGRAA